MTQETFLHSSAFIREVLHDTSDAARYPAAVAYPLLRFSVGEWLKTGAVMSKAYFTAAPAEEPEEDEPIIEPLLEERDDEAVTPQVEEPEDEPAEPDEAPAELAEDEEHISAALEIIPDHWEPLTQAIDQYFSFINRLVLFSPEIHKPTWQAFIDEVENIFSKATLTPSGLATRFEMIENLYRSIAKA